MHFFTSSKSINQFPVVSFKHFSQHQISSVKKNLKETLNFEKFPVKNQNKHLTVKNFDGKTQSKMRCSIYSISVVLLAKAGKCIYGYIY